MNYSPRIIALLQPSRITSVIGTTQHQRKLSFTSKQDIFFQVNASTINPNFIEKAQINYFPFTANACGLKENSSLDFVDSTISIFIIRIHILGALLVVYIFFILKRVEDRFNTKNGGIGGGGIVRYNLNPGFSISFPVPLSIYQSSTNEKTVYQGWSIHVWAFPRKYFHMSHDTWIHILGNGLTSHTQFKPMWKCILGTKKNDCNKCTNFGIHSHVSGHIKKQFSTNVYSMCTIWSKLCSTKFSCVVQYEYQQEDLSWCIWLWCLSKHKGKEETAWQCWIK